MDLQCEINDQLTIKKERKNKVIVPVSRGSCSALTKHKHHLARRQCINHYHSTSHTPCHDTTLRHWLFMDRHSRHLSQRARCQADPPPFNSWQTADSVSLHGQAALQTPVHRWHRTDKPLSVSGLPVPAEAIPAAGGKERPSPAGILLPCTAVAELTTSLFLNSHGIYIKPEGASNLYNFIVLPNVPKTSQRSRGYWRRQTHNTTT